MKFYAFHFAYIPYLYLECPLSPGLHSLTRVILPTVYDDSEKRIFLLRTAQTITTITECLTEKPVSNSIY